MADTPALVALLALYASEATITRPEVGLIIGKTVGQIAGIHNRNKKTIGDWPTLNAQRRLNRRCQFPVGEPGTDEFTVCGKGRAFGDPLRCSKHHNLIWVPPSERH